VDSALEQNSARETLLVAGAGTMGSGIAQVAAQSGHPVLLYDGLPGAALAARERLSATLDRLVERGKFDAATVRELLGRITVIEDLAEASAARVVIEAIVEDLDAKRALFGHLEDIVSEQAILASNTSSLSISAIGGGLRNPARLVGMHFFNPVPLMRLVEVVSGLQTDPATAQTVFALAESWGKTAVHAGSTPGFIVNRIARPFYAEALALLQERAAAPAELDACLRGAGFRMGPCELMDLIGQDVNLAVTRSVYEANFYDKRYQPSLVQQALVDAGRLGRKSGRGFYDYSAGEAAEPSLFPVPDAVPPGDVLSVRGAGALAGHIATSLSRLGCHFERVPDSSWSGLQIDSARLRLSDGRTATALGRDVAVFDLPLSTEPGTVLAWSHSARASSEWIEAAPQWLCLLGFTPQRVGDTPGLVVARTLAMLINEAAEAVQQGVCSEQDADLAMKLGVNYPAGPFEWLQQWGARDALNLLDTLDDYYRGERYRASLWLRQRAWALKGT
jgi:3-hydroxybutyryl-CoA dehydrogenase